MFFWEISINADRTCNTTVFGITRLVRINRKLAALLCNHISYWRSCCVVSGIEIDMRTNNKETANWIVLVLLYVQRFTTLYVIYGGRICSEIQTDSTKRWTLNFTNMILFVLHHDRAAEGMLRTPCNNIMMLFVKCNNAAKVWRLVYSLQTINNYYTSRIY